MSPIPLESPRPWVNAAGMIIRPARIATLVSIALMFLADLSMLTSFFM